MGTILVLIAYLVYIAFWSRLLFHVFTWYRAVKRHSPISDDNQKTSFSVLAASALDIIFFRRLFKTNKLLWLASWTFHVCFSLVLLRHSWYFLKPVPDLIIFIQPVGIVAGYILPFSLLLILILRVSKSKDRYTSIYNYSLTGLLFVISVTGLLMRNFFHPDLIDVMDFIMGILTFRPEALPDSFLFVIHFSLFLLLVPYIPLHLFTAPLVTMEAQRREQGLDMVLHEK